MKDFSNKEALSYGWDLFKKNKKVLILSTLIFCIFNSGMENDVYPEGSWVAALAISAIFIIVGILIQIGWYKILLKLMSGHSVRVKELFLHGRLFWKYLGALVIFIIVLSLPLAGLVLALVLVGFSNPVIIAGGIAVGVLSMVLSIYLGIRYQFALVLIVDKEIGIKEAFKTSSSMTEGVKWKLLGLLMAIGIINIIGVMALLVGTLVALPVTTLAYLSIYKKLYHAKSA